MLRLEEQLIELIYGAAFEENSWADFLKLLSRALPDGKATLFHHNTSTNSGTWELNYGFPDIATRQYGGYYSKINPWMRPAAVRPIGIGVVAEQMLEAPLFQRTEFYNDFYRNDVGQTAVGVTVQREADTSILLSIATSRTDANENLYAAQLLSRLSPHVRRVFRHIKSSAKNIDGVVLDAVGVGSIIVSSLGTISAVSGIAGGILDTGIVAGRGTNSSLRFCCERAKLALNSMLRRDYTGPYTSEHAVHGTRVTLVRMVNSELAYLLHGPSVAVLFEAFSGRSNSASVIAAAYKLTEAETRCLRGLLAGASIHEIAEKSGRSRETIRTQVKSLYTKLGVSSHIELLCSFGSASSWPG